MSINSLYKQIEKDYDKVFTTNSKKFLFRLAKTCFKQNSKRRKRLLAEGRWTTKMERHGRWYVWTGS